MKQGDIIQSDTAGVIKHRMMMKLITKLKTAICNEAVALYAAAFLLGDHCTVKHRQYMRI